MNKVRQEWSMKTKSAVLVASLICSRIVLVGGGWLFAARAGAEAAERSKRRLELVWPSLMSMPAEDRAPAWQSHVTWTTARLKQVKSGRVSIWRLTTKIRRAFGLASRPPAYQSF